MKVWRGGVGVFEGSLTGRSVCSTYMSIVNKHVLLFFSIYLFTYFFIIYLYRYLFTHSFTYCGILACQIQDQYSDGQRSQTEWPGMSFVFVIV